MVWRKASRSPLSYWALVLILTFAGLIAAYAGQSRAQRREDISTQPVIDRLKSFGENKLQAELNARAEGRYTKDSELGKYDSGLIADAIMQMQSIYGNDDRKDWFETPATYAGQISGVALVVPDRSVMIDNGTAQLLSKPLGDALKLCTSEKFRLQPSVLSNDGSICSGALIGKRLVVTAKHCIDPRRLRETAFLFDFKMLNVNSVATVSADSIYWGRSVDYDAVADWALVTIDRDVDPRRFVFPIRRQGKIPDASLVYVIGYPSGIPVKFADGATVKDNSQEAFFKADLDTLSGNSGSPVFSGVGNSFQLEGVLVAGGPSYENVNGCRIAYRCPAVGCDGEISVRATKFADKVPGS
jgi:hypothetical protein